MYVNAKDYGSDEEILKYNSMPDCFTWHNFSAIQLFWDIENTLKPGLTFTGPFKIKGIIFLLSLKLCQSKWKSHSKLILGFESFFCGFNTLWYSIVMLN